MLIMAIIGALSPTLFYQFFGSVTPFLVIILELQLNQIRLLL